MKGWFCQETFRRGQKRSSSCPIADVPSPRHTHPLPPASPACLKCTPPLFSPFHPRIFKIVDSTHLLPNAFKVGLGSYHQWKKKCFKVAINLSVACLQHRQQWRLALRISFSEASPFLGSQQLKHPKFRFPFSLPFPPFLLFSCWLFPSFSLKYGSFLKTSTISLHLCRITFQHTQFPHEFITTFSNHLRLVLFISSPESPSELRFS